MKVKVLEAKKSNESMFSKFSPTHTNTYNIFAMWPDNHLKSNPGWGSCKQMSTQPERFNAFMIFSTTSRSGGHWYLERKVGSLVAQATRLSNS